MIERLLLILAIFSVPSASAAPPRPAAITGRVLAADDSRPLPKTSVELHPSTRGGIPVIVLTGADGTFAFEGVAAGAYRISAHRNGFVRAEHDDPVVVDAGERLDLRLRLQRGAVVVGSVVDIDGEPMNGVEIALLRAHVQNDERLLTQVAAERTDDLGRFRLYGLSPGAYYIRASVRGRCVLPPPRARSGEAQQDDCFAPIYYPGTIDLSQAQTLRLGAGAESVANLVYGPTPSFRVRGRVIEASSGQPAKTGQVALARIGTIRESSTIVANVSEPDGAFEFRGVTPGKYLLAGAITIETKPASGGAEIEVTTADVDVGVLTLRPARELRGRIVAADAAELPPALRVILQPAGAPLSPARAVQAKVGSDGTFSLANVLDDRFVIVVSGLAEDAYLASAAFGHHDALKEGVDTSQRDISELRIVVSNAGARIEGTLREAGGGDAVVLKPHPSTRVFRETPRIVTTDAGGRYAFAGLRPGKYLLAAYPSEKTARESESDDPVEIEVAAHGRVTKELELAERP